MRIALHGACARHPAARGPAQTALSGLDLEIAAGEQLAVIGPSGAGKTTLLELLACALPPSSGQVELDGVDPWSLPRRELQRLRGRLLLAPQLPPLPPRQRVVPALMAAGLPAMGRLESLRSLLHPADLAGAHAALSRFDLADKLFDRVDRLSGGERQRVAIARALINRPKILLADEPTGNLDVRTGGGILDLLAERQAEGLTMVMVTHDQTVAARAHRQVRIVDGRVVD